ncbi:MAG TPA: M56 family metallopeptidase, partial [Rhodothermales bacterium]|nr:M56 family metallopeptidase [Rhodothermales bacterium]
MDILTDLTHLPATMAPWMSLMFTLLVKGMLVLAATGILVYALRQSSAALRYVVWSAGLMSLLLLPVLSMVLPQWHLGVLPQTTSLVAEAPTAPTPLTPPTAPVAPTSPTAPAPAVAPTSVDAPEPAVAPLPQAEPAPEPVAPQPDWTPTADEAGAGLLAGMQLGGTPLNELHWTIWAFLVWIAGVIAILARTGLAYAGVHLLLSRAALVEDDDWNLLAEDSAHRLGIDQYVRLRWSNWTSVPLSAGMFRPVVILPEEARTWPTDRRRAVLLHELAHVKRRDCLTQFLSQLTCAIYWFNPLTWVAARQLRIERERACDDMVLVAGTRPSTYAETLLETARSLHSAEWSSAAALAMARRSQLEGRLLAILDPKLRRQQLSRAGGVLAAILVACIVLPLAAMSPAQAQQTSTSSPVVPVPPVATWPDDDWDVDVDVNPDIDIDTDFDIDTDVDVDTDFDHDFDFDHDHDFDPEVDVDVDPDFDIEVDWENGSINLSGVLAVVDGDTLSIEQLIRLRKYGVDADFIQGLKALGYTSLSTGELINLSKYGADPGYIREMREAGFTSESLDDLAQMSKYGLDADFVRAMHEAGYTDLSTDDLVRLSKYGADAKFLAEMRAAGFTTVSADDLARMAKYGLDGDLVAALQRVGYTDLSVDDMISMSKYGVSARYIEALSQRGYTDIAPDDLIAMSKYGVDSDLIVSMEAMGYSNLS